MYLFVYQVDAQVFTLELVSDIIIIIMIIMLIIVIINTLMNINNQVDIYRCVEAVVLVAAARQGQQLTAKPPTTNSA